MKMDPSSHSNSSTSSPSSPSSSSLSSSSSSSWSSSSSPSFADRILAPLGFALLVLLVAVISYSFARRRRRLGARPHHGASLPADPDDDDDESAGAPDEIGAGLSEAAILSYPKLLYSNAELRRGKSSESCCSICLADYGDGDVLRLLPECDHYFHLKCVDPWLKLHSSCPICRKSLLSS